MHVLKKVIKSLNCLTQCHLIVGAEVLHENFKKFAYQDLLFSFS